MMLLRERQEAGEFLRQPGEWRILNLQASEQLGHSFDVTMFNWESPQKFWRLYAFGTADFAIRPPNPATIEGGPAIRFSTDDPRLTNPALQNVPGGDGAVYHPPRRYQLLELDQSWIIAERFEFEALPQVTVG